METLLRLIEPLQSWLFEHVVLPLIYHGGFMSYADEAFDATGDFVLALAEIALMYALLRPLEALAPVEKWEDRRATSVDALYTFLYRAGLLPLLFFVALAVPIGEFEYALRAFGYVPPNLEELVPWLGRHPLAAFLAYLVVVDFAEYWRHRLQHRYAWWWSLHALHHSQRTMSFWTDDRNHVLDGLIQSLWLAFVAQLIGVPGNQFILIVFLTRFVESLSHANLRLNFGRLGDAVLVSPLFHRVHHGMGTGHEGRARGCNFAVLFPVWDVIFGTANFTREIPPTGIRDQLDGVDYGESFVDQQLRPFKRLWRSRRPSHRRVAE